MAGYIFTTDEVKKQLKELNRDYEGRKTWGSTYGTIDLNRKQAESDLNYDYGQAVNEAYVSANKQRSAIANSAIGEGFKSTLNTGIDDTLMQAFESYRKNYESGMNQVKSSYEESKSVVDELLTEEANNIISYQEASYDYLNDLYNRAYGLDKYSNLGVDDKLNELFENDKLWNRYLTTDPYGENRLKTREELMSEMYDEDRNLTAKGADFYDQMMNSLGTQYGENYSFNTWLSNTNNDLYNWSKSTSSYNYGTLDEYGRNTNIGHIRTLLGLDSTDATYSFAERYGGISRKEIDDSFKNIKTKLKDVETSINNSSGSEGSVEDIASSYSDVFTEIKTLAKEFGIYDEVGKQLGSWEKFEKSYLTDIDAKVKDTTWWQSEYNSRANNESSIVNGIRATLYTIGSAFGELLRISTSAKRESTKNKEANLKYINNVQAAFDDLVYAMTLESYKKNEQANLSFNNRK